MKKTPIVILIPALAIALVVGGAMVWRLKTQTVNSVAASPPPQLPRSIEQARGGKPTNPFSFFFGSQQTSIPTPTPATVGAMNEDLQAIGDDGGAADFSSLQQDLSGL
jgi:hypothetical protein